MSISKLIENIYGFNPNKMSYDISYENDKFCYVSENLIILKFFFEPDKSFYGLSTGNNIRTIKFIKRGKFIMTIEIKEKEKKLVIVIYDIENDINLYKELNIDIKKYFKIKIKKVFLDLNNKLDFIITLLNENNDMIIFKGKLEKDTLDISCNYYCKIIGLNISIKSLYYIFEDNLLICSCKEKILSIRILSDNNNNRYSFQILNQISIEPFDYIPKSMKIIHFNSQYNNSLNDIENSIKILILSTNGKCNIYSKELILIKEISLNTIENEIDLEDDEEDYDFIYNFTYLSISETVIILGSNNGLINIYDLVSYNQKYSINISEINQNIIMNSLCFVYINEKNDIIYLILLNGETFYGKLSSILYKKKDSLKPVPYGHKNKIISLELSLCENENNNIAFYTISENGLLIKSYFDGIKFNNVSVNYEEINFTTCKINPKYNNLLHVGDDMGNLYIFDINDDKLLLLNKDKIANFKIDSISFNYTINNNYFCIGFDSGMLRMYNIDLQNYKCDFVLKICDDFKQNIYNNNKINSFSYFYEDINDNRICYLSNQNSITIGNLNSINNNLVLVNEKHIFYDINKFGYILDIKIHPSKKYIFILLSSNQIDIKDLEDINTGIGIIDFIQFPNTYKINFDITGELMLFSNGNNFYMYFLRKNQICKQIEQIFDISFFNITNDGRYIILCGKNGFICIILNFNDIKTLIYNYKDAEIKFGVNRVKEMFHLLLTDNILKERKFIQKNTINEKNKDKIKSRNFNIINQNYIPSYANNLNYFSNNTLQNINIMNNFNKNQIITNQKNRNSLLSNQSKTQRLTSNNFAINNNLYKNLINSEYNKNNFFNKIIETKIPKSNLPNINNGLSIFQLDKNPTLQKVDRNFYMNLKSMHYPNFNINIKEINSKNQQDNSRNKNISNAISDILKNSNEKKNKKRIKSFNIEMSKNDHLSNNNKKINDLNENIRNTNNIYKENESMDSSFYSRITNNGNFYINNGIEKRKKNILPDNDSIDSINDKKNILSKNKSLYSNSSYDVISNNENIKNINSKVENTRSDFSMNSFTQKNNNSVFDDIDNVEKDINKFEMLNRNFIK